MLRVRWDSCNPQGTDKDKAILPAVEGGATWSDLTSVIMLCSSPAIYLDPFLEKDGNGGFNPRHSPSRFPAPGPQPPLPSLLPAAVRLLVFPLYSRQMLSGPFITNTI